jgi:hypothetical protein
MRLRIAFLTVTVATLFSDIPLLAADDPAFGKDLLATIALHGLPCDKVIETKPNGDSDYSVSCKDGNRYHVFVNAQGRVIVQKL